MPVKVNINGRNVLYQLCETESDDGTLFHLKNDAGDIVSVKVPLVLSTEFKTKEFDLYFLAKKNIKESEIFQIYLKEFDTRIGWLIPIISLGSSDHSFATDPHFLKYAYIGIRESLKKIDDSIYYNYLIDNLNENSYIEIFHESTALLIISKETLVGDVKFNIDRATPSLIKYGYVRLGSKNPSEIELTEVSTPTTKKLYIEQISPIIESERLISELLNTSFAYERKAIFKFFLIYQIIELLLDDIYKHRQASIIDELVSVKSDSIRTKEVLEKLQSFLSEKKRIELLVGKYSNIAGELSELQRLCNNLLAILNRDSENEFQGYFYKIRNFIFHQYRDFPHDGENHLEQIIKEFLELMPLILSRYQYPTA